MPNLEKYYYILSEFGDLRTSLAKWSERVYIDVFENFECVQYIDIQLFKNKDKHNKPKTQPYQKVRPVLKELFEDHYNGALRYIASKDIEDWEYYIFLKGENSFEVEAYATNESNDKGCIQFNFSTRMDDLSFSVYSSTQLKGRPRARKKGTPITYKQFRQFYNISLQYLSEPESLLIYHEQFTKNFKNLTNGDGKKVELFNVSAEKAFKDIITQLENRRGAIEKRLIENDQDSREIRLKLRGELEGIKYSLKTIKIFK